MKILSVALLSLLVCPAALNAQTAEPPQIVVTGEGIVKATPDQAWVQIGAESRSKVSKEAQQRNAEVMTAVQQKVSSFGIPKDAIKDCRHRSAARVRLRKRQANAAWIRRAQHLEVRVDDLAKLGDVLDAAVGSGAPRFTGCGST